MTISLLIVGYYIENLCAQIHENKADFEVLATDQSYNDKLTNMLTKEGFENVSIGLKDEHLIITYENRIYRHEIKAMKKIMEYTLTIMKSGVLKKPDIILIPQYRKIPLVVVEIPREEYLSQLNGNLSDKELIFATNSLFSLGSDWKEIRDIKRANSSFYKLGIVLNPKFRAQFGQMYDPAIIQLNVVPEISTNIWKGMSASAQLIIPIYNEFEKDGDSVRPGLLTLNQTLRLPVNIFISMTAGYFTQNRYGTDLEIRKYSGNGKFSIGMDVGYTGYASYLKHVWEYSNVDLLTALVDAEYRFSRYDLSMDATYGKFLYGDKGLRFDVLQQFGEVDIGFFAIKTENGINGGFNFSIPIFPKKYLLTKYVRLSPAKAFQLEYRYKGKLDTGIRYDTGQKISEFLEDNNPQYIKNQMVKPD